MQCGNEKLQLAMAQLFPHVNHTSQNYSRSQDLSRISE